MAPYPASDFIGFCAGCAVPSEVSGGLFTYWFSRYHFIDRIDSTSIW